MAEGAALGNEEKILKTEEGVSYGSTDVGDVSWVVPTSGFRTATFVPGTPGHSWQSTACAGMSIGHKGMIVAAKTLAHVAHSPAAPASGAAEPLGVGRCDPDGCHRTTWST